MPAATRNILLITTDQMRFDALGCNGGTVARTPHIDQLAANGINYQRAHNQNVVCMPARATIMTGQHVASHGVWMNGVCLPEDEPTIAHHLQAHGYQTGLLGKAHFEPWLGAPDKFLKIAWPRWVAPALIAGSIIWNSPIIFLKAILITTLGCNLIHATRISSTRW